jgi:3-oxoacyl-[acyl-carrier protein] reductase
MDLGIEGKVALIGGGSSGLGLEVARELAAAGAHVSLGARDPEGLERARAVVAAAGPGRVVVHPVDLRDHEAIGKWVEDTVRELGGAHILLVNAGGPPAGIATDFDVNDYREAVELNLLGSIALVEAALPHLQEAGWGRVLFVTSHAVKQPIPHLALSNTARAGVLGYAKSLVHALGDAGITVNVLAPGPIRTDRLVQLAGDEAGMNAIAASLPLGRVGEPKEFAAAAAFLASARASFITGLVMQVDGGATLSLT